MTIAVGRSKLPVVKVAVSARSAVAAQKVESLRLMMDGRRLPGGAGFADLRGREQAAVEKQEWEVKPPPGRHTLAVLARSTDDAPSFSPPVDLLVPAGKEEWPCVHVLAVGVSRYATVKPDLNFAHTDAESVVKAVPQGAKAGVAYRTPADPLAASAFYDQKTGEFNVYHLRAFVYREVVREADGQQTPHIRMPLGHPAFTVSLFPG